MDQAEHGVPGPRMMKHLRRLPGAVLGKIEPGAKARTMAEDHHGAGFTLRLARCRFELAQERIVDGIALLRPVQADPGNTAPEFVCHGIRDVHGAPPPEERPCIAYVSFIIIFDVTAQVPMPRSGETFSD